MRRFQFLCLVAVLLTAGTVSADLEVYEYVPGQKVKLDTATGHYWYWNLPDFTYMSYDEQVSKIADLGTYCNIAAGWHYATVGEVWPLWNYTAEELLLNFAPTLSHTYETSRFAWGCSDSIPGDIATIHSRTMAHSL